MMHNQETYHLDIVLSKKEKKELSMQKNLQNPNRQVVITRNKIWFSFIQKVPFIYGFSKLFPFNIVEDDAFIKLQQLNEKKREMINSQNFERAAGLRNEEKTLKTSLTKKYGVADLVFNNAALKNGKLLRIVVLFQ